jgi:Leucine-rich repeat (LRR) protein
MAEENGNEDAGKSIRENLDYLDKLSKKMGISDSFWGNLIGRFRKDPDIPDSVKKLDAEFDEWYKTQSLEDIANLCNDVSDKINQLEISKIQPEIERIKTQFEKCTIFRIDQYQDVDNEFKKLYDIAEAEHFGKPAVEMIASAYIDTMKRRQYEDLKIISKKLIAGYTSNEERQLDRNCLFFWECIEEGEINKAKIEYLLEKGYAQQCEAASKFSSSIVSSQTDSGKNQPEPPAGASPPAVPKNPTAPAAPAQPKPAAPQQTQSNTPAPSKPLTLQQPVQKTEEYVTFKEKRLLKSEYSILEKIAKDAGVNVGDMTITDKTKFFQSDNKQLLELDIANDHVYYLNINGHTIKNLNEAGKLEKLEYLGVGNCEINEITGIDNLAQLQELRLWKTQIAEIKGLDKLTQLKKLLLSENKVAEIKELDNLTQLQELYLGDNQITEMKGLDKLTQLQGLSLFNTLIAEIKGLDKLTQLKKLNLSLNRKIKEIKGLDNLTQLQELYLAKTQIAEIKGLDNLTRLQELVIFNTQIAEIKGLDNLTQLQRLNLRENRITEIKGLDNLTQLGVLDLNETQITEIKGLDNLNQLGHLYLRGNKITEIKGLNNMAQLQRLNLSYNQIAKLKGLDKLPKLAELYIEHNPISKDDPVLQKLRKRNVKIDIDVICLSPPKPQIPPMPQTPIPLAQKTEEYFKFKEKIILKSDYSALEDIANYSGFKVDDLEIVENEINFDDLKYLCSGEKVTQCKIENDRVCELLISGYGLSNMHRLSPLSGIKKLMVVFNEISEIEGLENALELEYLSLSGNRLTKVERLSRNKNLVELDVSFNKITEVISLSKAYKLKKLNIKNNPILTNLGWEYKLGINPEKTKIIY